MRPTVEAYFKLSNCRSYKFYNTGGHRALIVRSGEVIKSDNAQDIAYYRARGDVVVETNEEGTPLDEIGRTGPGYAYTAKSYKQYRGRPDMSVDSGTPPRTAVVSRGGITKQPTPPQTQRVAPRGGPIPTPAKPAFMKVSRESPVEELQADGSTVVARVPPVPR